MENNNRQGCRWVKASERLPEKFEVLHLKIHNSPSFMNVGMYSKKNNSFKVQDDNYSTATSYPIEIVEWLDESIEPCATSSEAVEILKELCQLKHYKDTVGKDSVYEKSQPEAWKKANDFLNSIISNAPSPTGDRDCEELKKGLEEMMSKINDLIDYTDGIPREMAQKLHSKAKQLLNKHP